MSSPVRYVVRRQEWTPPNAAGVRRLLPEKWTAAATFAKPTDAHAECAKLLAQACRTLNPFQLGGPNLFYQTSLPAYALHDYLLDHDITPPPTATSSNPNYVFWWVKNNRTFTDDQRAVVWQACDKLKLFEVVEEDDRNAAWLVVEVPWGNTDGDHWSTTAEGGFIRSAWRAIRDGRRTKEVADKEYRDRFSDSDEFHIHWREGYEETDPYLSRQQVPFAELARVQLVGTEPRPSVYLVARQAYAQKDGKLETDPANCRRNSGATAAVAGTTDRAEAERRRSDQIRKVRGTVNPFTLLNDPTGWDLFEQLLTEDEREDRRLPNDLSVEEAVQILFKLDTTPPPPESYDLLADWYDQVVQWSPEFIDVIWGTFADFRLFEVIEVQFG